MKEIDETSKELFPEYGKIIKSHVRLLGALKEAVKAFNSIICNCAEGVEFFDRKTLMDAIEKEAMGAYNKIEQAIKEAEGEDAP